MSSQTSITLNASRASRPSFGLPIDLQEIPSGSNSLGFYLVWILISSLLFPIIMCILGFTLSVWFYAIATLWLVGVLSKMFPTIEQNELGLLCWFKKPVATVGAGIYFQVPGISILKASTANFHFTYGEKEEDKFEVTCASPADCNWDQFWKYVEKYEIFPINGKTPEEKDLFKKKYQEDMIKNNPDHSGSVFKPRVNIVFTRKRSLLDLYFRNVPGETEAEREKWLEIQARENTWTIVSAEFKFFTYSQLKIIQTSDAINDSVKHSIDKLILQKAHEKKIAAGEEIDEEINFGIECTDATISRTGASPEVHAATNSANAAKHKALAKATEGEGLEKFLTSEGKGKANAAKDLGIAQGEGKASELKAILAAAKSMGVTAAEVFNYLGRLAFAKESTTFFTDSDGGGDTGTKAYAMAVKISKSIDGLKNSLNQTKK